MLSSYLLFRFQLMPSRLVWNWSLCQKQRTWLLFTRQEDRRCKSRGMYRKCKAILCVYWVCCTFWSGACINSDYIFISATLEMSHKHMGSRLPLPAHLVLFKQLVRQASPCFTPLFLPWHWGEKGAVLSPGKDQREQLCWQQGRRQMWGLISLSLLQFCRLI